MSLALEMLEAARLAPKLLGESTELVNDFVKSQLNPDGGFKDRTGRSDLYYTVFGLEALLALEAEAPLEKTTDYLWSFGSGKALDFVHLASLARAWAGVSFLSSSVVEPQLNLDVPTYLRSEILGRLETFRTPDGGYGPMPGHASGTAYGSYLALGAYQDFQVDMPGAPGMAQSLASLNTLDGAWSNERGMLAGSTSATAAAVAVRHQLGLPIDPVVGDWLLARCHRQGGFVAAPSTLMPDLLSTAVALHALGTLGRDLSPIRQRCLDFIDSLWTNAGSFYGHWGETVLDCEYTFYGLLALGHLNEDS